MSSFTDAYKNIRYNNDSEDAVNIDGPYIIQPCKEGDYKSEQAMEQQRFLDTATLYIADAVSDDKAYDPIVVKNKIGMLRDYYDEYSNIVNSSNNPMTVINGVKELEGKYDKDIIDVFNKVSEEIADYNADKDACTPYSGPRKAYALASTNAAHPEVSYAFGEIDADSYVCLAGKVLESADKNAPYIDNNVIRNVKSRQIDPLPDDIAIQVEGEEDCNHSDKIDTEWYLN